MSTETRSGVLNSIIEALISLANKDTIEPDDNNIKLIMINPDFIKAWDNIEKGEPKIEAEKFANVTGGGSNRSNRAKLNTYKAEVEGVPPNRKEMSTENLEKMIETLGKKGNEIGDN